MWGFVILLITLLLLLSYSVLWWPTGRHDKLISIDEQNLLLWSLDSSEKMAQVLVDSGSIDTCSEAIFLLMMPSLIFGLLMVLLHLFMLKYDTPCSSRLPTFWPTWLNCERENVEYCISTFAESTGGFSFSLHVKDHWKKGSCLFWPDNHCYTFNIHCYMSEGCTSVICSIISHSISIAFVDRPFISSPHSSGDMSWLTSCYILVCINFLWVDISQNHTLLSCHLPLLFMMYFCREPQINF